MSTLNLNTYIHTPSVLSLVHKFFTTQLIFVVVSVEKLTNVIMDGRQQQGNATIKQNKTKTTYTYTYGYM